MCSAEIHKDTGLKNGDQKGTLPAVPLQEETFRPAASDTPGGRRKPETTVTSVFIHVFSQACSKILEKNQVKSTQNSILT